MSQGLKDTAVAIVANGNRAPKGLTRVSLCPGGKGLKKEIHMSKAIDKLILAADANREAGEFISVRDLVMADDHAASAEATGIPEAMLCLEEAISEGLPESDRLAWPGQFFRAARGRDLTMAWPRFALWVLSSDDSPLYGPAQHESVKDAVAGAANLYREWCVTGEKPAQERWAVAWSAATRDAARSAARAAARSAARAAWFAAKAADADADARAAAWAATWVAWAAAGSVARDAAWGAWRTMSVALLQAMESCPEE